MQPKFITFIQCTFEKDKWYPAPGSDAGPEENIAMRNMTVFCSITDGAKINLIDMNVKEVRIQFKSGSYVGIGNGMLYCKADDVIDTRIRDTPPEYSNPTLPESIPSSLESPIESEEEIIDRVKSITPQSHRLRFPMGYFYYIFCSLVKKSKNGEVGLQDLVDGLVSAYEWKYEQAEDIIGDALREGLLYEVDDRSYIRENDRVFARAKLTWQQLLNANLFKEQK